MGFWVLCWLLPALVTALILMFGAPVFAYTKHLNISHFSFSSQSICFPESVCPSSTSPSLPLLPLFLWSDVWLLLHFCYAYTKQIQSPTDASPLLTVFTFSICTSTCTSYFHSHFSRTCNFLLTLLEFHLVDFNHIHPTIPLTPPGSIPTSLFPPNSMPPFFFLFNNSLSPKCCPYTRRCGATHRSMANRTWPSP